MDFKDALNAEIESKKRQLNSVISKNNQNKMLKMQSTSVKVADLERQRQEEYLEKQRILEEQRQLKLQERLLKIKNSSETQSINEENSNESKGQDFEEEVEEVLNKEIEKKLKTLGQPIRLFGESDRQRIKRLKSLELKEDELSGGQRNDFYELMEKHDRREEDGHNRSDDHNQTIVKKEIKSIEEIVKIDRKMLINDQTKSRELLEIFFNTLIHEWQLDLDSRPDSIKKSTSGRMITATFHQTREYLNPFFKMLKKDEVSPDILAHMVDIVGFLQDREYVRANDTYLRLSIGNAPWPIGVTMVGIHERSAHEKINTGTVAHALNDEVTRKWIQSIKRLMTFCQKAHPPSDPSKAMG